MPGHICAVVVTTLVLEGWSNKLDPSHSVLVQVCGLLPSLSTIQAIDSRRTALSRVAMGQKERKRERMAPKH